MDVLVNIIGIIMYCEENIIKLKFGHGYSVEKCYLKDFPFKENLVDGKKQLSIEYKDSELKDENGIYFMCLKRTDVFQIDELPIGSEEVITDTDCKYDKKLLEYEGKENEYLHKIFSLLRLFKIGNIGLFEVFFEYKYKTLGFINNTKKSISKSISRNFLDSRMYLLEDKEIERCNQFLCDYSEKCYELLKPIIDEFMWGLEQVDDSTGFEQYITALEMLLLPINKKGKKQMLSNRVAVLIGESDKEIKDIHDKMFDFYRFRSKSLHEGDGSDISKKELIEIENYVRLSIINAMQKCKKILDADSAKTWTDIKSLLANELVLKIQQAKLRGVLD